MEGGRLHFRPLNLKLHEGSESEGRGEGRERCATATATGGDRDASGCRVTISYRLLGRRPARSLDHVVAAAAAAVDG